MAGLHRRRIPHRLGLARSFCELFREPDPGHWLTFGSLTAGIFYSLPMIAVGIYMNVDGWAARARRPAMSPREANAGAPRFC
jgi:prolipoprotein diacylglyceryltransferase